MKTQDVVVRRRFSKDDPAEIIITNLESPTLVATLAISLVERWGMIAAKPDGEDSAGRSKLALLTPAEIVERACITADLAVAEFRKRDWLTKVPSMAEARAQLLESENAR